LPYFDIIQSQMRNANRDDDATEEVYD